MIFQLRNFSYKFANLIAGARFSAAIFSNFDPVIGLFNASGTRLTSNDDANGAGGSNRNQDSFINNYQISTAGDYYLVIRSYLQGTAQGYQQSLFNSASGYAELATSSSKGNYSVNVTITPATVPVPASLPLMSLGLSLMAWLGRKSRRFA